MTNLFISKSTEAKALATILCTVTESLDPEYYDTFEIIVKMLCETRRIDYKDVGIELALVSGHKDHDINCSINNAPAYLPTPCDCYEWTY